MNSRAKKMLKISSLLALVGAIFLTSVFVTAPALSLNASSKLSPTVAISYNGTFSSSNEDYTVTPTASGITADSVIKGGWNYSSTDSYVAITAKNDKAIATQKNGITLTFKQRTLVDRDADKKAVDPYEQLFTVEDENGITAHICAGGVYYISGTGASSVYAQTPSSHYGMLTATEKHITITVDFVSNVIYVYFDGQLAQKYLESNSRYPNVVSVIDTFESVLTKPNSTLYLRKPCENKASRNTESFVMGDVEIHNSVFTAEQAAEYYESLTPQFTTEINVENLTAEEYTQSSFGTGFESNSEREGAFRFTDITSYLTVTANEGKKLVSGTNGISFHFYEKTTTDSYYKDEDAVRPNTTDDFEQLFCVEGENGELAYICTGGLYYVDAEGNRTYAQPGSGYKKLLNTTWKYVSIVVNNSENSISIYINGERAQYFSPTANKAAVTANVVALFSSVASKEGGSIYIRRSCPEKEDRNSATLVLDDITIGNGTLTDAQVLDYYDSALGNARIRFASNMENADIPDLLVKKGTAISEDSIPEMEGYVVEGLFSDTDYTNPVAMGTAINASCTLYVKYSLITYSITYHGATVSEAPTAYTIETNGVSIPDAQKEGYVFEGWYRTEKFENRTDYLVPGSYGNIDLYAKFSPIVYTVTYVKNGGVFQSIPVEEYTVETADFTPTDLWKAYYTFVGWYTDEQMQNAISVIDTANAQDITLYAKFAPISYTVTYVLG
ncbi:MAG: InlB B-repeat-containing protein, partial [Clostridia bacterium]|nr:InlB B-repeat-containing protein [Clostridia bacterium]